MDNGSWTIDNAGHHDVVHDPLSIIRYPLANMLGITEYVWRLVPGNPILLRVVSAAGKKKRDLFIRCGYLGILVAVVIWTIATSDMTSIGHAGT